MRASTVADSERPSRPIRACVLVALAGALALSTVSCASGPFAMERKLTRRQAIAACMERTPAEAVPYGDRFAACMESYGWTYAGKPS